MIYEAWRISYQSSEDAARAAYEMYVSATNQRNAAMSVASEASKRLSSAIAENTALEKERDELSGKLSTVTVYVRDAWNAGCEGNMWKALGRAMDAIDGNGRAPTGDGR